MFSAEQIKGVMASIAEKRKTVEGLHPLTKALGNEEAISNISKNCQNGIYKYSPYNEKLFLRGKGKTPREISIPTYENQVVLKCLDKCLKKECAISNQTQVASFVVRQVKQFLSASQQDLIIIRLDIIGYFENINHSILLEKMKAKNCPEWLIKLTSSAIKNPTKSKYAKDRSKRLKGIPQGVSISSHLADLYLEKFDEECGKRCVKYFRYVDDILLFVTPSNQSNILRFIEAALVDLGLEFHRNGEKFQSLRLMDKKGFNYLGYQFYPYKNCISIKTSSVQTYINSLVGVITKYRKKECHKKLIDKEKAKKVFLFELNEKITGAFVNDKRYGWLWYYKEMNDVGLLTQIDTIIQRELLKFKETKDIQPKSLKRSHYEIFYQGKNSKYILNYGSEDLLYMKKTLAELGEHTSSFNEQQIKTSFKLMTNKRIRRLVLDEVRQS